MSGYIAALAFAAFTSGLLGSVHCAAMCGGIAGALCRADRLSRAGVARLAAYHSGRILSYASAGAIVGAIGAAGLSLRGGHGAQRFLLYTAGVALLLMALYVSGFAPVVRRLEQVGAHLWKRLQPLSRRFLPVDTVPRALGLGALWGWLPCGMVYTALLTAVAVAEPLQSALVMLAFGAGTLPAMLGVSLFTANLRPLATRRPVRVAASIAIFALGAAALTQAVYPHAGSFVSDLCLTVASW
jgi:sulfite exporter TauE/SafE